MTWRKEKLYHEDGPFYFDALWRPYPTIGPGYVGVVVIQVSGKYYVGPDTGEAPASYDVGPYETLDDACIAAETLCALSQYPESWKKFSP